MRNFLKQIAAAGLLLAAATVGGPAAAAEPSSPLIVGGSNARVPYAVTLQSLAADGTAQHECGGTLVTPRAVVTAAHCAPYVTGRVRVGSLEWQQGGLTVPVKNVYAHPAYNPVSAPFADVAVVTLRAPVPSRIAKPIGMAQAGGPGSLALVQGWGTTCDQDLFDPVCMSAIPDRLQQLRLKRLPNSQCSLRDPATGIDYFRPNMSCWVSADGQLKQACFGDSGGPILRRIDGRWKLIALVSGDGDSWEPHEHICSTGPDGSQGEMWVTNVWPYRHWINATAALA